jgi:hypothetical protein
VETFGFLDVDFEAEGGGIVFGGVPRAGFAVWRERGFNF